jgi:hypothetical protein
LPAQYYGGYGEIEGGFIHLALVDMTGGVGSSLNLCGKGALDPQVSGAVMGDPFDDRGDSPMMRELHRGFGPGCDRGL